MFFVFVRNKYPTQGTARARVTDLVPSTFSCFCLILNPFAKDAREF
jgi:hypothetical protein